MARLLLNPGSDSGFLGLVYLGQDTNDRDQCAW
jgi:hypothetical protein